VAGTVILVLGVANQVLDYSLKNMRLNHLKKQASFIFKKHLPEAGPMVDPVQQLKTKREENKKTLGFFEKLPHATVADILKEMSEKIPPSLEVTIKNFNYEKGLIALNGEAKNMDEVSSVKNALARSALFQDVEIGPTSLLKEGGNLDFNLRIQVKE
jgi:Tfp pilus assembly protein PilN